MTFGLAVKLVLVFVSCIHIKWSNGLYLDGDSYSDAVRNAEYTINQTNFDYTITVAYAFPGALIQCPNLGNGYTCIIDCSTGFCRYAKILCPTDQLTNCYITDNFMTDFEHFKYSYIDASLSNNFTFMTTKAQSTDVFLSQIGHNTIICGPESSVFLSSNFYWYYDKRLFFHDDLVISKYLAKNNRKLKKLETKEGRIYLKQHSVEPLNKITGDNSRYNLNNLLPSHSFPYSKSS